MNIADEIRSRGLSIMKFGESAREAKWFDLGIPCVNAVFGSLKGMPLGRIVGIRGGESYGKSALAYWLGGIFQKKGGLVFLADEEASFSPDWGEVLGLQPNDSLFLITTGSKQVVEGGKKKSAPEALEDLLLKFEYIVQLLNEEAKDVPALIIWDSVASTLTRKELEGEYDNEAIAEKARVLSRGLSKLHNVLVPSNVVLLFVNQLRAKIGTYGPSSNTMPGGRALLYYTSVLVEAARTAKRAGYIVCKAENKKNKVAPPFKSFSFKIDFSSGIIDVK